jgi:ABC-type transport system involved in multi-copper enzyme maturation permease subunit
MLREKSFLLMMLMQMLLVSSSGLLSVGYVILTSPESSSTLSSLNNLVYVGVVTDTRQPFSQALVKNRVHHTFYDSFELANKDFRGGIIDTLIVGDVGQDMRPSVLTVFLPSNSPKAPLTKLALKKVMMDLESDIRVKRIDDFAPGLEFATFRIMNLKPQARYIEIYFIFTLPLLLFLPCIIAGSLAIDSITQDLESRRILNLTCAPLSNNQIVFGKTLASLILSVTQSVVWLFVLSFTFISPQNHIMLVSLCTAYTVIFMNVGTILALILKNMKSSQVLYTFVSMGAISLFSQFANISPTLLEFSPAYIITRTALGASPAVFVPQLLAIAALAALSTILVMCASKRINDVR